MLSKFCISMKRECSELTQKRHTFCVISPSHCWVELLSHPLLCPLIRYNPWSLLGLPTGQNTLRKNLHLTGLTISPLCRRCGTENETSAHKLCECEVLAALTRTYMGAFFLDPEDIKSLSVGVNWNFNKGTGLP
jgi:hypothetical protein